MRHSHVVQYAETARHDEYRVLKKRFTLLIISVRGAGTQGRPIGFEENSCQADVQCQRRRRQFSRYGCISRAARRPDAQLSSLLSNTTVSTNVPRNKQATFSLLSSARPFSCRMPGAFQHTHDQHPKVSKTSLSFALFLFSCSLIQRTVT